MRLPLRPKLRLSATEQRVDRLHTDAQAISNLLRARTAARQFEHFDLTRRESNGASQSRPALVNFFTSICRSEHARSARRNAKDRPDDLVGPMDAAHQAGGTRHQQAIDDRTLNLFRGPEQHLSYEPLAPQTSQPRFSVLSPRRKLNEGDPRSHSLNELPYRVTITCTTDKAQLRRSPNERRHP